VVILAGPVWTDPPGQPTEESQHAVFHHAHNRHQQQHASHRSSTRNQYTCTHAQADTHANTQVAPHLDRRVHHRLGGAQVGCNFRPSPRRRHDCGDFGCFGGQQTVHNVSADRVLQHQHHVEEDEVREGDSLVVTVVVMQRSRSSSAESNRETGRAGEGGRQGGRGGTRSAWRPRAARRTAGHTRRRQTGGRAGVKRRSKRGRTGGGGEEEEERGVGGVSRKGTGARSCARSVPFDNGPCRRRTPRFQSLTRSRRGTAWSVCCRAGRAGGWVSGWRGAGVCVSD
jgi:hypothetical protein